MDVAPWCYNWIGLYGIELRMGRGIEWVLGHCWCLSHTCCCIYSLCTTVQRCNVQCGTKNWLMCRGHETHGRLWQEHARDKRHDQPRLGEMLQTDYPWQKCCRQTGSCRDKNVADRTFPWQNFHHFRSHWAALVWNLPKYGHHDQLCRWEQREIHNCENPRAATISSGGVKSSHCSLWSQFASSEWFHRFDNDIPRHTLMCVYDSDLKRPGNCPPLPAKPEKSEKAGKPQQICGRRQVSTMNCNVWTVFTIDGGQCSIYTPTVTLYMAVPCSNPIYGSSL